MIAQHYVNDEDSIPAATSFEKPFEATEQRGWHKVRLLDATGEPSNDQNIAEDTSEKPATTKILAGDSCDKPVQVQRETKHLLVAVQIPLVFVNCTMCHDKYENVTKGS